MEEEAFPINNLLFDFEVQDSEDPFEEDEFLLKPSNIIMDEEEEENIYTSKESVLEGTPEIKIMENQKIEPVEEFLFKEAKLLYDDKELDSLEEKEDDEYLFRPIELIEEDPLELFNKRREQGIVISTRIKPVSNENNNRPKPKPRGFLANLKMEIKAKVLDKKD